MLTTSVAVPSKTGKGISKTLPHNHDNYVPSPPPPPTAPLKRKQVAYSKKEEELLKEGLANGKTTTIAECNHKKTDLI
jgi:hypothetical protein